MHPRNRIEYRIGALRAAGLWRDPQACAEAGGELAMVDARSNDYLGLARRAVSRETSGAVGSGASRLVAGTHPEHRELERELADWLGYEECLLFSSGYAANVGVVSALAGPGETILSDALNHASIIDGCRLSRADVIVLPHRDVTALERALAASRGVRWVVTESYFGMDGDSPDLREVRRICDVHGAALIVDEAHAVGVFGPGGRGLCAERGVVPDAIVGGMGKAFGIQGGFAACTRLFRDWLWNRARSMVFSTAPSPVLCSLAMGRVKQVREADAARAHLRELELRLAAGLRHLNVQTPRERHGPIFPVVLGSESAVLAGAARARELGVLCHPIRPPTVPRGSSRLRVTLRADMSVDDVDRIARALEAAWRERSLAAQDEPRGERATVTPNHGATEREPPRQESTALGSGAIASEASARVASRWIVLGTGTGVGKTFVAQALVRMLAAANEPVAGLKPIETGLTAGGTADAALLEALASSARLPSPHPLYAFAQPITPSRAARADGVDINLRAIASWVGGVASTSEQPPHIVIETAGGVFSPLADRQTNFDLSTALGPATWVLVAPNRLGVLHDVTSALHAMTALGRRPDWIILSAPEAPDASTSSNREELTRLSPAMPPVIELPRNDARPLEALLQTISFASPPQR